MSQSRQDPAPDDLDTDLDFGLVAWLVGARRNNGGAVGAGPVRLGPVGHPLREAGLWDPRLESVADCLAGAAPQKSKSLETGRGPKPPALGPPPPPGRG